MKFRKKPLVIEAFQVPQDLDSWDFHDYPDWMRRAIDEGVVDESFFPCSHLKIETLEGVMVAKEGDWIIRGVAGEIYPCKPDIFEATYEAVTE